MLAQAGLILDVTLIVSGAAAPAGQRVALDRAAIVRGSVVRLTDLLPAAAPQQLRSRARGIILGDAPVPGGQREFTRDEVVRALHNSAALRDELEIPPDMEVRRWARRVTPEEVLAAIDRTLRASGSTAGAVLTANDVQLAADVAVTEDAPKLQVTQIQPAGDGESTRVLLWVTSEPRVPPFWARLDRAIHLDASRDTATPVRVVLATLPIRPGPSAIVPASDRTVPAASRPTNMIGEVLVKAGDPVELVVQVGGMRIQGTGIPLDRGRQGDEVRVRTALSGKIVVGTVVGEQTVQLSF